MAVTGGQGCAATVLQYNRRMPFKVQVGPPQIAIHQGQIILLTETDGQIAWPSDKGLYFFDTRVLSAWAVYANGETLGPAERRRHPPTTRRGCS